MASRKPGYAEKSAAAREQFYTSPKGQEILAKQEAFAAAQPKPIFKYLAIAGVIGLGIWFFTKKK